MTISIHRTIRQQRFAVFLGLAALLGAVAFALFQEAQTEPVEVGTANLPAIVVTSDSANHWEKLRSVQDGYLPPVVTRASAARKAFLDVQDDYLPPTEAPEADVGLNGISDSRTNRPR
jgi:hypothetical protein